MSWNPIERRESVRRANEAAERAALALMPWARATGLRWFRNGGSPLFERRTTGLSQELLIRLVGRSYDPANVPATLTVYVNSAAVGEARGRGLGRLGCPSPLVAGGDTGGLLPGMGSLTWNLADPVVEHEMTNFVQTIVGPWLAQWEEPDFVRDRLFASELRLITHAAATEYLFVNFGQRVAERYLDEIALADQEERRLVADSLLRIAHRQRGRQIHRLALVADCYGLRIPGTIAG